MILPNLIPSQGRIEFKACYNTQYDMLRIVFRDPATWCQTSSIALKCTSSQMAVRWLYKGLKATFDSDGLARLWAGGSASGTTDGNLTILMSIALAEAVLLTDDIYTIWFTGAYSPFETRQYSLELLWKNQPRTLISDPLANEVDKAFKKVSFPANSHSELTLLTCECQLLENSPNSREKALQTLAELFVTASIGEEKAIVMQLHTLEEKLLKTLTAET